jgi:succinate dehydrogenase/fumarate reductase flavoprotein subunit
MARMMQYFCSEYKTEKLLNMGLDALSEIEKDFAPNLYALDPHKLLRSLEDLSILQFSQLIIRGSLARKASSRPLNFQESTFPDGSA